MNTKNQITLIALLFLFSSSLIAEPLGTAFTYQGQLYDGTSPAEGQYDFRFWLYDTATGTEPVAEPRTVAPVAVTNGLFTVNLDFGTTFRGDSYWLEINVRSNGVEADYTVLLPRQLLTPTPYALYAPNAGAAAAAGTATSVEANGVAPASLQNNAVTGDKIADGTITASDLSPALASDTFWRLDGNAGTTPGTHFLGTTDDQALELQANYQRILRLEPNSWSPNIVGGHPSNYVDNAAGATVAGGGSPQPGEANWVVADYGTVSGGTKNSVTGWAGTVSGGFDNTAGNSGSVGGGRHNVIAVDAPMATISGGRDHTIGSASENGTIGGGNHNTIAANVQNGTIAGGSDQTVESSAGNTSIGGGWANRIGANSWNATIAGGQNNSIRSNSWESAIGGGGQNLITRERSTIAGGWGNRAAEYGATVSGGQSNVASGWYATVPGGNKNSAAGTFSFAAGRRAQALHNGAFVWADTTDADFASTAPGQFLIRAAGGVGIGTTSPAAALEVQSGAIKATGGLIIETRTSDPPSPVTGQIWLRTDL